MARAAANRNLPLLKTVLENCADLSPNINRRQVVLERVRYAAQKLRTAKSRPFYSMREVASFFRVSLRDIFVVYQALEREGLISRFRGSNTMLMGETALSKDSVRGVVGLPVWIESMMRLPYTRTLVIEMEERLRRSGYVADIIFYHQKEEEGEPDFALRLLNHRLDAVVMHTPLAEVRQNILALRERGVRMLVIQGNGARRDLPALIYLQDYVPAYQKLAARWRETGGRKVYLWIPPQALPDEAEVETFVASLKEHELETELVDDSAIGLLKKIRRRKTKRDSMVAFIEDVNSERIWNGEPLVLESISRLARLAFCAGRIQIPYFERAKICVDIVDFSPIEVAARLAEDIGRLPVLRDGVAHTFTARYHDQVVM